MADRKAAPAPDPVAAGVANGGGTEGLVACPGCDALYRTDGAERLVCGRCHRVLIAPGARVVSQAVGLSMATVLLLAGALSLPFVDIRRWGLHSGATMLEVALAFQGSLLSGLALATVLMIAGIPLVRALLVLFSLGPVATGRAAPPGAARAFRLSEALRPWSMAEVFAIGLAVALVKIGDLARVEIGPAVYLLGLAAGMSVLQDLTLCRWSVWRALERRG